MPASSLPASPDATGDIGAALELDLEDLAAGGGTDCIGALACGRSSFSYRRLPEPRLRLTVQKLDDSFFDIEIARSATVWELKVTIENLFSALYDDTQKTISWNHVWSHFCLCFKDERLTDDKATLRGFGIRDGDVVHALP
ncbi:Ubiquitin-like superfamily protein [Zea mays]|uniref:Ubiquitin-like superfamily protein n=1 Tax=Zea mays TaxID=4577 RepID=A0A1D6H306_MAIZE|nr:Ubiquitin-like superfamily protein [Zea mays]